jgi:hypothetical protein
MLDPDATIRQQHALHASRTADDGGKQRFDVAAGEIRNREEVVWLVLHGAILSGPAAQTYNKEG